MSTIEPSGTTPDPPTAARLLAAVYAVVVYMFFLATFACAIAFVGDMSVAKGINSGTPGPAVPAVAIDLALLAIFALQHSVMARRGFKAWWTKLVPRPVERTTFVLAATGVLALLIWQWRPLPGTVWTVDASAGVWALESVFWAGWAVLLASTWLIDHFELFGLRQAWAFAAGRRFTPPDFKTPALYRVVRHPLYLGFIMAFWATPHMTWGHLLFSGAATGYIFIGILLEERDLVAHFGERYRRYQHTVPMIVPLPAARRGDD